MSAAILAIDPGANGGLALLTVEDVIAYPMPEGMAAQIDALRAIAATTPHLRAPGLFEKKGGSE